MCGSLMMIICAGRPLHSGMKMLIRSAIEPRLVGSGPLGRCIRGMKMLIRSAIEPRLVGSGPLGRCIRE
jgi:hypothetical protein